MIKVVNRIDKTIHSLRNFSRQEDTIPFNHYPISSILEETLLICQDKMNKKSIELEINCPNDFALYCNDIQLSQVFINLIQNSCDAIENLDERWIKITTEQDSRYFYIIIQDSGQTPPSKLGAQIFNQYFTTKEKGAGTGLGLAISKKIMEAHQGSLRLLEDTKHTTFECRIPRSDVIQDAC